MRIVAAFALLCALAVPASAQSAAQPARPAAKPAPARTGHALNPLAERIAIQWDLIWTGDLISIADGEWGNFSTNAVKAFQRRKGGKDTGVLTPEERATLAAEARQAQDDVGWRTITDENGIRVGIPGKLVPQARKGSRGSSWRSARGDIEIEAFRELAPATLAAILEQQRRNPARKIEYKVLKNDFFVISGSQGSKKFYMRAATGTNDVRGVTLVYDPAVGDIMKRIVVAVSSAFAAVPPVAQASGRPVDKRKVEYATGVVVSAAGDIVTDREAIGGCQVIVVSGVGNAERVAEDKASGLALIRVYGATGLKPLALGQAPRAELTLVGIADPQAQAGRASVSLAKSKVTNGGETYTLESSAAQGFAGAAAIDAEAGFAGIVVQKPQVVAGPSNGLSAVVVPSDAIRKMLAAQNVNASAGVAGVDFAKDSVVRVICVRR